MLNAAIDYFTKWVEAKAVVKADSKATKKFVYHDIVLGHPQANGQVKVTNRTLLHSFKKRLSDARTFWAEEIPNVLWAYRTTPQTATGESPFSLTFGVEAVIPVELEIPSPRIEAYDELANPELLRNSLDLVEERREKARIKNASYQQRVARYYNSWIKERNLRVGDLVLLRAEVPDPRNSGKLAPTSGEPYRVARILRPDSPTGWNA
ncbi:uncharacterized protein LOC143888601 [Tasmannia lanceolata]|uniref:uncharacterized protein LOC143888601 n=1 Tax=Tasmannia lanceolata TaxID=3420 RepID=UPI004063B785